MNKALIICFLILGLTACSKPDEPTISLYLAVQRGDIDQLDRHLHWDTDINSPFPNGSYPLHIAASNGRVVMVNMLLDYGAQINALDRNKHSAADVAILAGRTQVSDVLFKVGAKTDASALLIEAAKIGASDRDTVTYLIKKGADLHYLDNDSGENALMIAIRNGNSRLVNHLVDQGNDINKVSSQGKSPLAIAKEVNEKEIMELLLQNGAR